MKIGNIPVAEDFKSQATLLNFKVLGNEAQRKKEEEKIAIKKKEDMLKREGMFQQVLELDSEDAMALNGMGEILLEREEFEFTTFTGVPVFSIALFENEFYAATDEGSALRLIIGKKAITANVWLSYGYKKV